MTHESGKVTIAFKVQALRRSSSHAVRIRTGSCKEPGGTKYDVDRIRADRNGAITLNRTVSKPGEVPRDNWNLVVYEGAEASSRPLLCGDIGPLKAPE